MMQASEHGAQFVRNAWYVAGWGKDLANGVIARRRLLDQDVIAFRDAAGKARMLEDRCPHRHAPLHLGKLRAGVIQCAYHGLCFDAQGACIHNPHGQAIPRNAKIRSYELMEHDGALWAWTGTARSPEPPPSFAALNCDDHYIATDHIQLAASYLLAIDNILDLSHLEFLHPTTLGSETLRLGDLRTREHGNMVRTTRTTQCERLPRMLEIAYQLPRGAAVTRTLDVTWLPPAAASVVMTVRPLESERAVTINSVHFFTPETETTCNYYFAIGISRQEPGYGPSGAEIGLKALRFPFEREDKVMLEAQQRSLERMHPSATAPVRLPGDAASAIARRIIGRLVAAEKAPNRRAPREQPA